MNKVSRDLTFLLIGAATGTAIGLLYAPDRGKVTRDRLSYRLSKYREQVESMLDDLLHASEQPDNNSRDEGERVVNNAREKAEQLLADVDRLMAQIKQQNA
ncbi:YtxH domain-containing protein [Spirosoma rhododendri]|uniref:YtxH domain-containing protein n=1 Tax=Spirosoma rhododendri TaxID=2728024 RepID=A0A7L5DJM4_9BACT|nr:YtxH domain-containing protein [Spirosoma rhododendri]QJD77632.1 YtxH domain-containing protein [Spirosoma rhododendri]